MDGRRSGVRKEGGRGDVSVLCFVGDGALSLVIPLMALGPRITTHPISCRSTCFSRSLPFSIVCSLSLNYLSICFLSTWSSYEGSRLLLAWLTLCRRRSQTLTIRSPSLLPAAAAAGASNLPILCPLCLRSEVNPLSPSLPPPPVSVLRPPRGHRFAT